MVLCGNGFYTEQNRKFAISLWLSNGHYLGSGHFSSLKPLQCYTVQIYIDNCDNNMRVYCQIIFSDIHNFFFPTIRPNCFFVEFIYFFLPNHKTSNHSFPSVTKSGSKVKSYSYSENSSLFNQKFNSNSLWKSKSTKSWVSRLITDDHFFYDLTHYQTTKL